MNSISHRRLGWMRMAAVAVSGLLPLALNAAPDQQLLGKTDAESTQVFEQEPLPPAGSPNVIYILLDDVGFSDIGAFGSEIDTPNMDRLADQGLRYNNFHTRAICSPTRAALLTGRNSHAVGVGTVASMNNGFPNGQHRVTPAAATVAQVLRASGYRTYMVGKWHLNPAMLHSSRRDWPLAKGFDQYYGFLDGMTDQYTPDLVQDNTLIPVPVRENYHLSEDLMDKAIDYIATATGVSPERPFFLYIAFGAAHAPHQVTKSYVDKYVPVFEKGWDQTRADRLAKQKRLGIVPANTELAPVNPGVAAWSALSEQERAVFTRLQATFAGMLEHTDEQIGRLLAFLDKSGRMDDTLIVLTSDNGGSIEGGAEGTLNELQMLTMRPGNVAEMAQRLDEFGSASTSQNYPTGWTMASNTPFRFFKTTVWDGGTHDPLIVHWPKGIAARGEMRSQFVDVIDVTPTVLELATLSMPVSFDGVAQMPLHGKSFAATFDDAAAPSPRSTQYFELIGHRAIRHNGWRATTQHTRGAPYESDKWFLFDTTADFSGAHDLAAKHPEIVADLQARWWTEAGKYGVLPLMEAPISDGFVVKGDARQQHKTARFRTQRDARPEYIYYPEGPMYLRQEGPQLSGRGYTFTVETQAMSGDEEGVLVAAGDQFGGYSFYIIDGSLYFSYNDLAATVTTVKAENAALQNAKTLAYRFDRHSRDGGTGHLLIDGRSVASAPITAPDTLLVSLSGFDIGADNGGHATPAYRDRGTFAFPRDRIVRVKVNVDIDAALKR
jgi:arylsulfatase A-like enzyme